MRSWSPIALLLSTLAAFLAATGTAAWFEVLRTSGNFDALVFMFHAVPVLLIASPVAWFTRPKQTSIKQPVALVAFSLAAVSLLVAAGEFVFICFMQLHPQSPVG